MAEAMRFGLHTGQHHVAYGELRDLWQRAGPLGFDACYLFDHFRPLHSTVPDFLPEEASAPDGPCLEAATTAAALAREVPGVGIGVLVFGVAHRSVALLLQTAAALQQAAAGRLEIGVGAGWLGAEHGAFGLAFPTARARLAQLEQALDALREWRGPARGMRGPRPRIWVAGPGERVTLRLAAAYADSWNAMFLTPAEFRRKVQVLSDHCGRAGRAVQDIERSIALRAFCSRDGTRAGAQLEGLAVLRGRDPAAIRDRSLVGTPLDCVEQLARYAAAGATHVAVMVHPPYDLEALELLAAEVFPRFR